MKVGILFHCLTYVLPIFKSGFILTGTLFFFSKFLGMEKEKMEENQNKSDLYVSTSKLNTGMNEFLVHKFNCKKSVTL